MARRNGPAMQCAVAVSRSREAEQAGHQLAATIMSEFGGVPPDLACVFFSVHHLATADLLVETIQADLAPGCLVGCSGEGVIGGREEIEGAAAATVWAARLPGVRLTPLRLSFPHGLEDFSSAGWPEALNRPSVSPVLLVMADPYTVPMDHVIDLIDDRCPGAAAIGGLAGGGQDAEANRLILNGVVHEGGLVGVALTGSVSVRTVISQGCRPVGERFVVTKAEHNVIHELSGSPALERLQAVFESLSGDERRLAPRALHLGIAVDEHRSRFERGDFLIRNLIGADRGTGSVAIGDQILEGQTVQFQLRDAASASQDLALLLADDRLRHRQPPRGALLFSCCGRGRGLFGHPHHDVTVLRERSGDVPIAGFFAQGEIGPVGGRNFVHGYTASVALFAEPSGAAPAGSVGVGKG